MSFIYRVTEIENQLDAILSPRTQTKLKHRVVFSTISDEYVVNYVGVKHSLKDEEAAIKKLAERVEEVCSKFEIFGRLGKPIRFDLENGDGLYLYYIAFTPTSAAKFESEIPSQFLDAS